jgi:arginase
MGQPKAGTELGPLSLRQAGIRASAESLGWVVRDVGDVDLTGRGTGAAGRAAGDEAEARSLAAVGRGARVLHEAVYAAARNGDFVLTLGGDHSVALGSVSGILRARPQARVVWVDAHADIHDPSTSVSGNAHGMPLSFLIRLADPSRYPGYEWLADPALEIPPLETRRLVYVGLRDVDAAERRLIRSKGIKAFTMADIDRHGIGKVMEMALDHVSAGQEGASSPLHLSFDVDACDPSIAPSTGTAVAGGLNYRESHYVCEACAETGRLGSMDMVEVNPRIVGQGQGQGQGQGGNSAVRGPAEETAATAAAFIASARGKSILAVEED